MVGHPLSFVDKQQKLEIGGSFQGTQCYHGNGCDVINILKVELDNSVTHISIRCLHK